MKYLILLIAFQLNASCEKIELPIDTPCIGDYNLYSTDSFDYVKKHLSSSYPIFRTLKVAKYLYSEPVFNPNNPYEIAYIRHSKDGFIQIKELWKFSFCTGVATQLADNVYYNLDWSSKGWLSYTGTGHQIFVIKENGDSLTKISTLGGYNRAGQWNPSGTVFWNYRDDGMHFIDIEGEYVKKQTVYPFGSINWLNDTTLIGWRDNNFYSLTLFEEELVLLNSNSTKTYSYVDLINNDCYVPTSLGTGFDDYLIRYGLNGDNSIDTIYKMYDSYMFTKGDIANGKIITALARKNWTDVFNEQLLRQNIMIMDLDGTNERLVKLP